MNRILLPILWIVMLAVLSQPNSTFADADNEAAARIKKYTPEVTRLQQAPAPAPGVILMVGSSIFRKWETCTNDLAPFPVTNRAFGGSQTADQLYFFDRIVPSSHASLVIWYCGSNDVKGSQDPNNTVKSPASILQRTKEWIGLTQAALPHVRILLVSVIRAPQKRDAGLLDKVDEVNKGLIQLASSIPDVSYVDVNPSLENKSGEPVAAYYVADKLHLTQEGYQRMAATLKPVMEREWIHPQQH